MKLTSSPTSKVIPVQQSPLRWWIYQRERFPLVTNGLLIAAFSSSAVSYSALMRGSIPSFASLLVAFATCLIFFLQLRIADEFKDYREDLRFRPYRPVPRGLVTLAELGTVGVASGILQLGMAVGLSGYSTTGLPVLVLPLVVTWLYIGLMSQEFFVSDWIKAHPIIYMLSHMVVMPLIYFYATACDWLVVKSHLPIGLAWFLGVSFVGGLIIEVGRKIRSAKDEEIGVETYTYLWGQRNAVWVWLSLCTGMAILSAIASYHLNFLWPTLGILGGLLTGSIATAVLFLKSPRRKGGKRFEWMSGIWTLLVYLCLGAFPLLGKLF